MKKSLFLLFLPLAALLSSATLGVCQEIDEKPYVLERSTEWTMKSAHGTEYKIMVSVPEGEAPDGGYPVVYVLDGNEMFPVVTGILRLQGGTAKLSKHNGIAPGVVVGIGYSGPSQRDIDYTLPAPLTKTPETYRNGKPYPERASGGAEKFFTFIENELKPLIEQKIKIDAKRQTLMGNGYGGLFTLHVLFKHTEAFQSYVAASPSVWWNGRYILEEEKQFTQKPTAARLLLTVGENEQSLTKVEYGWAEDEREEHRNKIVRRNMLDSVRELYWRLGEIETNDFTVEFESFRNESHKSSIPMSISRSLPFVFPAAP